MKDSIFIDLEEDHFIFDPFKTDSITLTQLQKAWFEQFEQSMRQDYGENVDDFYFVFSLQSTPIGLEWIEIIIERTAKHKETEQVNSWFETIVLHRNNASSYPYERLKEESQRFILAQALHQYLHSQSQPKIVNVLKLALFLERETTTFKLTPQGLLVESDDCHESWCEHAHFTVTLPMNFVHDESLSSSIEWLDPLNTGIFKSDPVIDPLLPMKALTFDDGPKPISVYLHDILLASNTRATFFWIGLEVVNHPSIAQLFAKAEHEIGNHTYHHFRLDEHPLEKVLLEINKTDDIIEQITGVRPTLMRPPYGILRHEDISYITHRIARWNVDTMDWYTKDKERVLNELEKTVDGDIILMHDVFKTSHQAVEVFIQQQLAQGMQFVTMSELIEHRQLKGQVIYGVRKPGQ